MDEKNFSLMIIVFVLVVAVPGMIFVFSDSNSTNSTTGKAIILNDQGMEYPYEKVQQYNVRGVDVPIYNEKGNLVRYETRMHTKTGQKKYDPTYEQTYSAQKNWDCPKGYLKLSQKKAAEYKSMGRTVENFGGTYCWYPSLY